MPHAKAVADSLDPPCKWNHCIWQGSPRTWKQLLIQTFSKRFDNYIFFKKRENWIIVFFWMIGMPVKLRSCVHCNTAFTSAVSLSNHLRAYARKKSAGLLTGTGMFAADVKSSLSLTRFPHQTWRLHILISLTF